MRSSSALVAITAIASLLLTSTGCGGGGPGGPPPANTPPVARFTVTPASGTVETEFQFDASSSTDAEDVTGDLLVRWDWNNDGTYDTSLLARKTATHTFTTPGNKTVTLLVKDTGGLTDTTTRTIAVSSGPPPPPANTPPVADFTVTPASGTIETEFQFDASSSTDAEDATTDLLVRWDWNNDGTYDTSLLPGKTATHTFTTPGNKTVTLLVTDTGGLTDTTSRSITVSGVTGDVGVIID